MNDYVSYVWSYAVSIGVIALVILLIGGLVRQCQGQSIEAQGEARLSAWPMPEHSYQHRWVFDGAVTVQWGPAVLRPRLQVTRWGTSTSILQSAMWNAESKKATSRRQLVFLGAQALEWLELGVTYDRRSVDHDWHENPSAEDRHNYFPHDDSWRTARARCEGRADALPGRNRACPGIGYWEQLRPTVTVETGGLRAHLRGPGWTWKDLTLPWPDWIGQLSYRWQMDVPGGPSRWAAGLWGQTGGHRDWAARGWLRLYITERLFLEGGYARFALPEWRRRAADSAFFSLGIR